MDFTATDIFRIDVQTARVEYFLNKKRRGEHATQAPACPPDPSVQADPEIPAFLKRQAD